MKHRVFVLSGTGYAKPVVFLSAQGVQDWFVKNKKLLDGEHLIGGGIGPNLARETAKGPLEYPIPVDDIAKELKRDSFTGLFFGYKARGETFQPVYIEPVDAIP